MKIENSSLNSISPKKSEEMHALDHNRQRAEAARTERAHDKAEFSENARLLAKAHAALNDVPDAGNARFEQIKQSVQDGTYTVSVQSLAQRLTRYFKP